MHSSPSNPSAEANFHHSLSRMPPGIRLINYPAPHTHTSPQSTAEILCQQQNHQVELCVTAGNRPESESEAQMEMFLTHRSKAMPDWLLSGECASIPAANNAFHPSIHSHKIPERKVAAAPAHNTVAARWCYYALFIIVSFMCASFKGRQRGLLIIDDQLEWSSAFERN